MTRVQTRSLVNRSKREVLNRNTYGNISVSFQLTLIDMDHTSENSKMYVLPSVYDSFVNRSLL